jgi:hypothetical protein
LQEEQRLEVFRAQTENVQELERTWKHVNRQLNYLLLSNNSTAVHINTKLLALIYCAHAEAIFSKLIHTPKGLTLDEIEQVKTAGRSVGVKAGWIKCVELGMRRVQGAKSNHRPNAEQQLERLVDQFVFDPSLLRNKLAHGQWCIALNRDNDAVNAALTAEISKIDVIDLYRRKAALQRLAAIIEDIIESPNRAHHRDYWIHLDAFEKEQGEMAGWTLEAKLAQLKKKAAHASLDA